MRPPFARLRLHKCLLTCLLAGAACAAAAQNTNQGLPLDNPSRYDEEQEKRNWKEAEVPPPAYPSEANLIEFEVSASSTFRFYIDAASLSVGTDGVVRYTLVARSPSGVANVSFEGIRCSNKSYRVYAQGTGGRWSPRQGDWRDIEARTIQRWHNVLYSEYLCPRKRPIQTAAEGVDALRRGAHPAMAVPFHGVSR